MNLLFTIDYGKDCMDQLRQAGHIVNYVNESAPARQLTQEEMDCDVIIGYNFFPKYPLSLFPKLKYIQLVSVGFNHIPIDEIRARNLPIYHNVGKTRFPIGEWVMWQILSNYKCATQFYCQQKEHVWRGIPGGEILELTNKTVVFLGAGNIAQEVARKCKAFDAKTIALNLCIEDTPFMDEVHLIDDIEKFLPTADVLVSCLPATPQTYHMLSEKRLSIMKDSALLVNISRGTVIDEEALIRVLNQGKFRGVCLDVFEKEPLDTNSPLWDMDRVLITPHNAIASDLSDQRVFDMVVNNINRYAAGQEPENPVHYERGF